MDAVSPVLPLPPVQVALKLVSGAQVRRDETDSDCTDDDQVAGPQWQVSRRAVGDERDAHERRARQQEDQEQHSGPAVHQV